MKRSNRVVVWGIVASVILNTLPPAAVTAGDWPFSRRALTTVERLASQIDKVEEHIDEYGTVVAKAPDVWGQARMTKYRREYEEILSKKKDGFELRLNGALSRSDQAFLATALAMQAAVSGPGAYTRMPVSSTETRTIERIEAPEGPKDVTSLVSDADAVIDRKERAESLGFGAVGGKGIGLEPTVELDQLSRYLNHLHELRRINDGDDSADAPGYAMHLVRMPISILPGEETREGYGAEVTIIAKPNLHDDLLPNTFRQLVINDLVDQLAFPIAKFLDSKASADILKKLDIYLAVQANPELQKHLSNATKAAEAVRNKKFADLAPQEKLAVLNPMSDFVALGFKLGLIAKADFDSMSATIQKLLPNAPEQSTPIANLSDLHQYNALHGPILGLDQALGSLEATDEMGAFTSDAQNVIKQLRDKASNALFEQLLRSAEQFAAPAPASGESDDDLVRRTSPTSPTPGGPTPDEIVRGLLADLDRSLLNASNIAAPAIAATPSRRSVLPFPPAHLPEVYGSVEFLLVAKLATALRADDAHTKSTLILDLQKFINEELHAAYEFLVLNPALWQHCAPDLHNAVRTDDAAQLKLLRSHFMLCVPPALVNSHTAGLAWMIMVESALLEARLKQDIHDLALAKNAYHLNVDSLQWMQFAGPTPGPDARQLFNDYVACRWPIHVVAVDPITQDQNLADRFSQRREMQMALAVALASGRIGANSFTRMVRRQELEMETIALHRTVVGFSHGDDTFGWRFLPRFQSPDTGGHFQTFAIDMFKGMNRDRLIKASRLEPGIREVTAIIIMPSFVPYVVFDIRSNWFELTDPSKKVLTLKQTMQLSADITSMRQLSMACAQDAHLYRGDDVYRLQRSVEQLERRLPLQTSIVQMPFENSLGGFEFFNTGVPDLAPELHGFYGEPGIKVKPPAAASTTTPPSTAAAGATGPTATASSPVTVNVHPMGTPTSTGNPSSTPSGASSATSIFLVGDHFSVHETEVIAGNVSIKNKMLLSRQVMQIDVPDTVQTIKSGDDLYVDIHVATPYGISNHLLVPVAGEEKKKEEPKEERESMVSAPWSFAWKSKEATGCLMFGAGGTCPTLLDLSDIVIDVKQNCPTGCCDLKCVEFAAFVVVKDEKDKVLTANPPPATCATPYDVECCNGVGTIVLNPKDCSCSALEQNITDAIRAISQLDKPAKIELQGCLRITGCDKGGCSMQYIRMPPITIKVKECPAGTCVSPVRPRVPEPTSTPPACQPVTRSVRPCRCRHRAAGAATARGSAGGGELKRFD